VFVALFFLLLVLFIVVIAVAFAAFPPHRIAEWLTKKNPK
jgi:hypothetical protein